MPGGAVSIAPAEYYTRGAALDALKTTIKTITYKVYVIAVNITAEVEADMDTDVLIVGAGPTGLMLANQLVRRGVKVQIIDRHSGPAQQSRAMAVQARTMEIYSKLGIADQAIALGKAGTGANLWSAGAWRARIPLGDIGQDLSPFPYVLILGQDDNERIMGKHLLDQGVAVQWNTELLKFEQHADAVTATLKTADGATRRISAAYMAGCDGARSAVREQSGISFPGAPYEHVFFVADTVATGPMRPDELNIYLWRDGFHLLFPMRGQDHWRIVGMLPQRLLNRDNLTFDDVIPAVRDEAGAALKFQDCSWFSTYRIHHRCAEKFRDRRCFLLGDAAHIHSPAGGQGMNTGLQDAYNLAWKLALVVQKRASPELLETYAQERRPVAQRLLATTDRLFMMLVSDGAIAKLFRTRIVPRMLGIAMTVQGIRRLAFRTISQIGIRYRQSPLSTNLPGLPAGAPRSGDRFPWLKLRLDGDDAAMDLYRQLDDTRFNLLIIDQPAPAEGLLETGELLRIHLISHDGVNTAELARANLSGPAFYLLRPDGHVALAGGQLDTPAVSRYLSGLGIRENIAA
jgi:2-polyprenyl-6-methoxyphenol hydroxylase-like FAD-dependent oxidoreductase